MVKKKKSNVKWYLLGAGILVVLIVAVLGFVYFGSEEETVSEGLGYAPGLVDGKKVGDQSAGARAIPVIEAEVRADFEGDSTDCARECYEWGYNRCYFSQVYTDNSDNMMIFPCDADINEVLDYDLRCFCSKE
jgi:hypothetical protein